MKTCYHETCDFAGNPEIKPESLYFLAKTAQVLTLAVAELTEGGGKCNLDNFDFANTDKEKKRQDCWKSSH